MIAGACACFDSIAGDTQETHYSAPIPRQAILKGLLGAEEMDLRPDAELSCLILTVLVRVALP